MKIKFFLSKLSSLFGSVAVVFLATLLVASVLYAATTISSNISTGGNLDVDGTASTTNATTTGYLYVGQDITEPPSWDFGLGDLIVTDDVYINSQATSSASFWVGPAGGNPNYLNLAAGDLYVADDLEVDGSATTTSLWLSNDLGVGGNSSTTGDLIVGGGTLSLSTGTATTTAGLFVGASGGTGTTTVGIGTDTAANRVNGCLEFVKNGAYVRVYPLEAGTSLVVEPGRCN